MALSKRLLLLLLLLISLSDIQANKFSAVRDSICTAHSAVVQRLSLIFGRIPQLFRRTPCEWTEPSFDPSTEESDSTPDVLGEQIEALYNVMEARLENVQLSKSRYDSALLAFTNSLPNVQRTAKTTTAAVEDLLLRLAARLGKSQRAIRRVRSDEKSSEVSRNSEGKSSNIVDGSNSALVSERGTARQGSGTHEPTKIEQIFGTILDAGTSIAQETNRYHRAISQWAADRSEELGADGIRDYVESLWKEAKELGYEALGLNTKPEQQYSDAKFRKTFIEAAKQVRKKLDIVSSLTRNTAWDSWDEETRKVVTEAMEAMIKMDRELMEKRDDIVREIEVASRPYTKRFRRSAGVVMKELRITQYPLLKQWANEVLRVLLDSFSPELVQMLKNHFEMMRAAFEAEAEGFQAILDEIVNSDLFQSFTTTRSAVSTCGQDTVTIVFEWIQQMLKGRLLVGLALCIVLYFIDFFFYISGRLSSWMEARFHEYQNARSLRTNRRTVIFQEDVSREQFSSDDTSSGGIEANYVSEGQRAVSEDMVENPHHRSRGLPRTSPMRTVVVNRAEERRTPMPRNIGTNAPMSQENDHDNRSEGNRVRTVPVSRPEFRQTSPSTQRITPSERNNTRSISDEKGQVPGQDVAKLGGGERLTLPARKSRNNAAKQLSERHSQRQKYTITPTRRSNRLRENQDQIESTDGTRSRSSEKDGTGHL